MQQFINGLTQGSIYALIALGYTMVYGVLRLINFAHGDVYMLGAYFGVFAAARFGARPDGTFSPLVALGAFAVAMVGAAIAGIIIERFAYRPLRNSPKLTLLITAIGMSMLLEYGGQLVFGPNPQPFPALIQDRPIYDSGVWSLSLVQFLIIIVAALLMLALHFIVQKTKTGRAMRAVSLDRAAAALMGINTEVVIAITFALGSALAAAAGVLTGVYQPTITPLIGLQVGLKAFVAAVLGGIGSIPGAMLGGLLMGFAEVLVISQVPNGSAYSDAVAFTILIVVLLFKPAGIMGRNVAEKV